MEILVEVVAVTLKALINLLNSNYFFIIYLGYIINFITKQIYIYKKKERKRIK
jgi:hypothetical protein